MQTYSHLIITAALARPLKRALTSSDQVPPVQTTALLWGSIMPDLPLTLLAIGCGLYDRLRQGSYLNEASSNPSRLSQLFDDWFFNNPWVIVIQNVLHSPLLLIGYMLLGYRQWRRGHQGGGWVFWCYNSCLLHTLIDIPLHHNDGPLLLFPLNWTWRFISPVSYWDPKHHGRAFSRFEHGLGLILLVYLFLTRKGQKAELKAHLLKEAQ